jgi:hypothetical protein
MVAHSLGLLLRGKLCTPFHDFLIENNPCHGALTSQPQGLSAPSYQRKFRLTRLMRCSDLVPTEMQSVTCTVWVCRIGAHEAQRFCSEVCSELAPSTRLVVDKAATSRQLTEPGSACAAPHRLGYRNSPYTGNTSSNGRGSKLGLTRQVRECEQSGSRTRKSPNGHRRSIQDYE